MHRGKKRPMDLSLISAIKSTLLKTIGRLPQMKQEGLDNSIQKTTLSTVMAIKGETVTLVK